MHSSKENQAMEQASRKFIVTQHRLAICGKDTKLICSDLI